MVFVVAIGALLQPGALRSIYGHSSILECSTSQNVLHASSAIGMLAAFHTAAGMQQVWSSFDYACQAYAVLAHQALVRADAAPPDFAGGRAETEQG
jgi:hypothetical protein